MRGLGAALSVVALLGFPGAVTASPAGSSSYVPGELLVRFATTVTSASRTGVLGDLDATVVERLPLSGLVRVRLEPGTSVEEAAAAFERRAGVRYAHPNHRYRISVTPNDTNWSSLWGMTKIDAPTAWDTTTGSNSITVAVVDTGIDYDHPDLAANMWTNGSGFHGRDFVNNDDDPDDDEGHGTHVAGTIGAVGNNGAGVVGVNWQVKLMALKAADADGFLEDSWVIAAFQYACANGAKVVNASFGGPSPSDSTLAVINGCPNTLFAVAAGNGGGDGIGDNNDLSPEYPCSYPSPNIVCVAASEPSDARSAFSNYGLGSVDIAAPGAGILSTYPGGGYATGSGTSMATPHVAGAAALLLSSKPALATADVRRALLLSADPLSAFTGLTATGGRLNARRALSQEITLPAGLSGSSTSPSLNAWSNVNTATAAWGGATDASGIDGYSFSWSPDSAFVPDEVKDAEENVTSSTATLPDGRNWFHVRARDGAGNWGETVHVGPFLIDTFPPPRPTLSSPTHRAGLKSTDRTVDLNWTILADPISGLDGFSFSWSRQQLVTVDQTKEAEESVFRTASPRLDNGSWWFGIRARDNAGNWTETTVLGPFVITGTSPVCLVPRLRGLTLAGARRSLAARGCALGRVTRQYSRRVGRGKVVGQKPAPGLRLPRGAKVAVVLSRGRRR